MAAVGVVAWAAWRFWPVSVVDAEGYVPSEEFVPAYEALEAKSPDYDIEETVRAMNALEVAQYQSEDFFSYLEYVARQDFSKVAPEVLEQKRKLFPILQKLFDLQREHKELSDAWMLMKSAASGATTFVGEINPVGVIGSMLAGDVASGTISASGSVKAAQSATFEAYERQKNLKRRLEREIEAVRLSYVEYLEEYAPIYHKYMEEWNALCLKKDKAYVDIYGGRPIEAGNSADEILRDYPANREALLLKSLSLIQMAADLPPASVVDSGADSMQLASPDKEGRNVVAQVGNAEELYEEAESLLDNYVKLYPSRSAPALVLRGLLCRQRGENAKAVSWFDQASMEYPRQAEALTDLLDSYRVRVYLNRSAEGKMLLRFYRSTMEGFGMFSPNLLKAGFYARQGDVERSKEEIFNHFFRRGNQGVYDCLLSDMQYCEEHLYSSFRQILMEQSFLDVSIEPTTNWTLADKDDEIRVIVNNRSDIDLENVRIFLCLHYTDMYKDEYDVQKLPPVNILKRHEKTEVGVVKLNSEGKKYNDITRVRAIAMTDDKICWIDNVNYKYMKVSERASKAPKPVDDVKGQLLDDLHLEGDRLLATVEKGLKVYGAVRDGNLWDDVKRDVKGLVTGDDGKLRIELPRILSIIDPVFSLYQVNDRDKAVRPSENYLSGSHINLKFDYKPKNGESVPLYIYSDFANIKVTIEFKNGIPTVKDVALVRN